MALIHRATLSPSKLELLAAWLPGRPWAGDVSGVRQLGAYRFDDPAGEVGVESFLLAAGDAVLHVPLTYRAAPLDGADAHLVGTTEHSVLGTRWVYDGAGDPVYATTLATAALTGGTQVEELVETDGQLVPRQPTATVTGSGTPGTPVPPVESVTTDDDGPLTRITAPALELTVIRVLGTPPPAGETLTARWEGGTGVVATAHPR